jgi:hypothetical protein
VLAAGIASYFLNLDAQEQRGHALLKPVNLRFESLRIEHMKATVCGVDVSEICDVLNCP